MTALQKILNITRYQSTPLLQLRRDKEEDLITDARSNREPAQDIKHIDPVTLETQVDPEMLCTHEAHTFVPYGRLYFSIHPGSVSDEVRSSGHPPEALHTMFKDFSIHDRKESWTMRRSQTSSEGCDEELYTSGRCVIWSRGTAHGGSQVLRCFTADTPVIEALWCNFLIPVNYDIPVHKIPSPAENNPDGVTVTAQIQSSVCVVEAGCVNVFTHDGCNYVTALPFSVKKTWEMKYGLLFERKVIPPKKEISKTPRKECHSATKLPILFSLTHPLEELAPVICKTGNTPATAKISFFTESSQKIVYTSAELSVVMTFDSTLQSHSLWTVRRSKPEEADVACGFSIMDSRLSNLISGHEASSSATPLGVNHSGLGSSHRSMPFVSQSPFLDNLSPFRSCSSKVSSPSLGAGGLGQSRILSPNINRLAVFSRSHSPQRPNSSLFRLRHSPSSQVKSAPASFQSPGVGAFGGDHSATFVDVAEPLTPEICLEHIWSETANNPRDGSLCAASKVFHVADLSGQQYICYLVKYRHQLRCVRFEESNDKSHLVFGSLTSIPARDALPLTTLQVILVLDMKFNLVLYSGTMKMNVVHIPGLPNPSMLPQPQSDDGYAETSYQHGEPVTSSRPPSALDVRFAEELHMPSPVTPEMSGRFRLLESPSVGDELSFQGRLFTNLGCILSLSDAVDNRFTLELTDNSLYRAAFPEMTCSPIIYSCLQALRWILPRDSALLLLTKWYCLHNAPGISGSKSEWNQFLMCLLNLIGYDINSHPLLKMSESSGNGSNSPTVQLKKRRLSGSGADSDWNYLINSDHQNLFLGQTCGLMSGLEDITDQRERPTKDGAFVVKPVDTSAALFPFMNYVLYSLHLVYEEMRLDVVLQNQLTPLGTLLYCIAYDLGYELYVDHYCRDVPELFMLGDSLRTVITPDHLAKMLKPNSFSSAPPNIYHWLHCYLLGQDYKPFPYIPGVNVRCEHVIAMYGAMFDKDVAGEASLDKFLHLVSSAGRRSSDVELNALRTPCAKTAAERIVLYMAQLDQNLRSRLAVGAVVPMKEAISHCQNNPPSNWPEAAYILIGREDLAKQLSNDTDDKLSMSNPAKKDLGTQTKNNKEEDDGINSLDYELLKLRFSKDLRIKEVRKLLQSSLPVCINITQKPEISDHEFIEEQERYLFATSIRTMALPVGRGMLTLRTYHPIATEALPIPKLCLTGRAPPRNTTIEMTHIDVPANMSHWPQFHNGVAAGLRISNNLQLESTWILFNKARSESLTNEHAGFLMGQGLNGHLSGLPTLSVHDYLIKGHEMTSMGLLLGISANKRGTMDLSITKLLSIHIAALLPPTSTELDVPHNVQVAAILGVGLVYQGTAHRHIAEVLLAEIGRPPGPEMENSIDRESYSLAAGLALGFVMLGKGSQVLGLSDMGMPDQLYHYMVGGQKRPLTASYRDRYKSPSYQIKEGECVNVDVTGPGATLALGMMFFNTNNSSVAEWFVAPDTQSLLDLVRPDFLMLRTLAHSLIMWQSVEPNHTWIRSNLPQIVARFAFEKRKYAQDPDCDVDFETMSQAYCNIMAGGCMAVGLKYAGSCNQDAFSCLYDMAIKVLRLMSMSGLVEQAGKTTVENCLSVIIICLAMVMAGSGDLSVLRLCRVLRSRIGSPVTYGSHMAVGTACGLLFLGGGKYTLNTRPESVAAMLCSFYPRFPNHSNDNRFHLQAFRHLYVLAVEKRLIIPRDVSTNKACYVELEIVYKDGRSAEVMAPYMLPELDLLSEVKVKGPRYWTAEFKVGANWDALKKLLSGTGYLFVKQRAGYLSFDKDPKGYQSLLAQSLSREQTFGKILKTTEVKSFTNDPFVLGFAEFFCTASSNKESQLSQMLSQVLYECVSHEKLEILSTLTSLHQHLIKDMSRRPSFSLAIHENKSAGQVVGTNLSRLNEVCRPVDLWQLKLLMAFYERMNRDDEQLHLISPECIIASQSNVQATLASWLQKSGPVLTSYFGGRDLPRSSTEHSCHLLSAFLTWYNIPHPKALRQMGLQELPTFPALFNILRPSGLSLSSIMALASALQCASTQQSVR